MDDDLFVFDRTGLEEIAETVLARAAHLGARDATVRINESSQLSVEVRNAELESLQRRHEKQLHVTLHIGDRSGSSVSSDFSPGALEAVTLAAFEIAARTGEDAFAGPVGKGDYAEPVLSAPDLYHPWHPEPEEAIVIGMAAEAAALANRPAGEALVGYAVPSQARRTSSGAKVSAAQGQFLLATSRGFRGGYPYSAHSLSVEVVAKNDAGMQAGRWWSSARASGDLDSPEHVGGTAALRALRRLDARRLPTGSCSVLFEASVAAFLPRSVLGALSGGAQYRGQTFLKDSLGQPVMASHVGILENPMESRGMASAPFDLEGVPTRERTIVEDGVAQTYLLDSYAARRLGLPLTGHAGGAHNARMVSRDTRPGDDLPVLIALMGRGLLVTEMLGGNANPITGDYSQGVAGFWVEGGEIRHAVEEVTIAGNLRDMLNGIVAIGSDDHVSGALRTGSIMIDQMRIGGL
ncbi:MAG TPA: metallopeptidase TldD-related protein [Sphingobium sp.]